MNRIRLVAIAALAVLGLGACGGDSSSSGNEVTLPAGTLPGAGTLPDISIPGVSIPAELLPPNLTEECMAISLQFAVIMSQVFSPTGEQADIEQVFGDISSKVPEALRADVLVLGEAFQTYAEVLQGSNNDFTNPDVQAALESLSTAEVDAASERISAYFEATCPQG